MNKASWERGFAHGSIYKTEVVDLAERVKGDDSVVFGTGPGDPGVEDKLDADGLPHIGSVLRHGDPFYSYINLNTGQSVICYYRSARWALPFCYSLCFPAALMKRVPVLSQEQGGLCCGQHKDMQQ